MLSSSGVWAQSNQGPDQSPAPQFTLGIGAAVLPTYEGSKNYETRALPIINYRNGRFFAGALGGVGYTYSLNKHITFGPLLSYQAGRDEHDDPHLFGLGDIDSGIDIGAFARWDLRPFFLHGTAKHGLGDDINGTQIKLGIGITLAPSPADSLTFDTSVVWSDASDMQAWYGVTSTQSVRSGLTSYQANSGIRRVSVGALWTHSLSENWFSSLAGNVSRLGQVAANSPITQDRNASLLSAGIGYRF
jgi:outer membrane protein